MYCHDHRNVQLLLCTVRTTEMFSCYCVLSGPQKCSVTVYCQDHRNVPIMTEYHFPTEMFRAVCYKPINDTADRRHCKLAALVSSRDKRIVQSLKEHEVTTVQLRPVPEWREAQRTCNATALFCLLGTDTDCWPWAG